MKYFITFCQCVKYAFSIKYRKAKNAEALERIYDATDIRDHVHRDRIIEVACGLSDLGVGSVWLGEERITSTINKIKFIM